MAQSTSESRSSFALQWLCSAVLISVTLIVTVLVVRSAMERMNSSPPILVHEQAAPFNPGVLARLTAGGVTIEREFPALDIDLKAGQSLDERLPSGGGGGAFEAEFTMRFMPRQATTARIGAVLRGGSIIIMRKGVVLHSNFVGDDEKTILTTVPESFSRAPQELTYIFKTDGKSPVRLQAVWQPIGTDKPQPLPMPAK